MSTIYYESNDTLYHHGIKGQKWGVRRFQNKDGSWTGAGAKRYGEGGTSNSSKRSSKMAGANSSVSELTKQYNKQNFEISKKENEIGNKYWSTDRDRYWKELNNLHNSKEYKNLSVLKNKIDTNKQQRVSTADKIIRSSKFKSSIGELKKAINDSNAVESKYLGESSKYYKEAFNKYKNKYDSYSFSHYGWKKGLPEYDAAYNMYKKEASISNTKIKSITDSISKQVIDTLGNETINNIKPSDYVYMEAIQYAKKH